MADDFEMDAGLVVGDEIPAEIQDAARLTVASHSASAAECRDTLRMLGLIGSEQQKGCRHCGGPLSIAALSSQNGYRGCCSPSCRDRMRAAKAVS
ncbi:hypothetical protein [Nocardia rhizosphaerae]|uniref:Uncharacterized protein n=1 Tax=Nocardia rhizosphaerae TaxID=1691571 RepID=A0ABV8L390_9NOCA